MNNIADETLFARARRRMLTLAAPFLVFFLTFFVWLLFSDGLAVDAAGRISAEPYKYLHNMLEMPDVYKRQVEEGAEIVLTNTAVSIRMGTIGRLAEKCNTIVVPADATSVEDLENLIDKTMEHFGGKFDFMLHSIGMSPNVRKGRTYDDLDYDYLSKTLDISAISFHKAIQVARRKDAINDWGSIVALSYIAAQRTLYGYNDMADAKALLESIARSFGYIYGREKHVRINTVSQSPTPTTAGSGVLGLGDLMEFAENMSPLGNASAEDCADYVLTLFSDLTRKVTMQNLYHDGGFSSMGMSRRAMKTYEKGLRFDDVHQNQYRCV